MSFRVDLILSSSVMLLDMYLLCAIYAHNLPTVTNGYQRFRSVPFYFELKQTKHTCIHPG